MLLFVLTTIALAIVLSARQRGRLQVGTPIQSSLPYRGWRAVGSLLLAVLGVLAVSVGGSALTFFLVPLIVAIGVHQIRPSELDRVAGTDGVRVGWNSRSYSDLEEWRLTGEHLRFRLFGQWTAVPIALEKQAPIRMRLLEVAAARESSFNQ